ncbi:MAG TPA: hypothetical protein VGC54_02255 [Planctomycetota bacterium]
MDPRLEQMLERTPEWLRAGGPEADVVVASRVRLARNLCGRRFPHLLTTEEAREICTATGKLAAGFFPGGLSLDPSDLGSAECELLVERSLASRDLLEAARPTGVHFDATEAVGLMVNEEDHFRMQGLAPGLDLERAHKGIRPLSIELGRNFELARHDRYGWLTACPTNTGTGLRASLLLHLPALARARMPLQRALQAAQRSYLAVRGVHGEGSRALGNFYQISNQRTLGSDVQKQIQDVSDYARQVSSYEREVREALLGEEGNRRALREDVRRAWNNLAGSEKLSTAEALDSLSTLRLAAMGGLDTELELVLDGDEVLVQCFQLQPGHLQARIGTELDPEQRDRSRARLLRESLGIEAGQLPPDEPD